MASKQLTPLTDEEIKTLIDKSRSAKGFAHAPYSNFPVGAALLAKDGRIFTGESVVFDCARLTSVRRAVDRSFDLITCLSHYLWFYCR